MPAAPAPVNTSLIAKRKPAPTEKLQEPQHKKANGQPDFARIHTACFGGGLLAAVAYVFYQQGLGSPSCLA